jgi:prolyl 4-hydroxylase
MSRFKHIVENFLTQEECKGFIEFSEKQGYQESLIRTKAGEVMNKEIRDNDRFIWDNTQFAEQLWELVKDMMPTNIDGYEPTGLNI